MKKAQESTVDQQKQSGRIGGLITETEARLTTLDSELALQNQEHDRLAAAEELDTEALESLRMRSAAILAEKDTLTRRVSALRAKKGEAERQEAAARIEQIIEETEDLVQADGIARSAYSAAVAVLMEKASALVEIHKQHRELTLESVFLMELFGFTRPAIPQLRDLPNLSFLNDLGGIFASRSEVSLNSPWSRKRQELQTHPELRQHPPREPKLVQAAAPLPARETVTIPVKPEHDEDHKPNRLQQLLRG
jgi:hypothetical protein